MAIKNHFRDAGRLGSRSKRRVLGHGCGTQTSVTLDSNGLAWTWGQAGQLLGDGDPNINFPSNRNFPVLVLGSRSFVQVGAGGAYMVALMADGTAWTWGGGAAIGRPAGANSPGSVVGNHSFVRIVAGPNLVLALKADGTCWAWGDGGGQFGGGGLGDEGQAPGGSIASPVSVHGNHSFVAVAAGGDGGAMGLKANGEAWCWGSGDVSGDGTAFNRSSPVSVLGNHSFVAISQGAASHGLKADGSVWGWGNGTAIGDDDGATKHSPVRVLGTGRAHSFVQIATGENHAFARKADGSVFCWGLGTSGQIGNNATSTMSSPVSVFGGLSFSGISSGANHSLAIRPDGAVFSWGDGSSGQSGDNGLLNHSYPDAVYLTLYQHSFAKIFAGYTQSIALKADGTAWSWGYNGDGRLGVNTNIDASSPASVAGGQSYSSAASGQGHMLLLKSDGAVWASGVGGSGQLGEGSIQSYRSSPVLVIGTHKFFSFTAIACGGNQGNGPAGAHSAALNSDGTCWAWGSNSYGQGGNNTAGNLILVTPSSVVGGHTFVQITAMGTGVLALKSDGTAWAWGYNGEGQLADNTATERHSPTSVVGNHSFIKISGAIFGAMALKADGTAWGWGRGANGQIGNNALSDRSSPSSVAGNHSFVAIACGDVHTLALKADGTCWAWGANSVFQGGSGFLGDNTNVGKSSPVSVVGNHSFVALAAGGDTSLALKADGTAWGWGFNNTGQLGDNTNNDRSSPVSVVGNHSFVAIGGGTGSGALAALKADGTAWTWGVNSNYQLGDGTNSHRSSPVSVVGAWFAFAAMGSSESYFLKTDGSAWFAGSPTAGEFGTTDGGAAGTRTTPFPTYGALYLNSFTQVAAGSSHSMGLASDGSAWVWGDNTYGQAGINTNNNSYSSPVSVLGNHSFVQLAANYASSLGLKADGTAWAWGYNLDGEVGDNSLTNRSSPTSVFGGHSFVAIAGGAAGQHFLGLKADGTIRAWGQNAYGQLGSGPGVGASTPISVLGSGFNRVFAGQFYSMASKTDGTLWAWGIGSEGELGTGNLLGQNVPTQTLMSFPNVAAGGNHSLGLESNGRVWAWGYDYHGALGDNNSDGGAGGYRPSPVLTVGAAKLFSFTQVIGGGLHSVALKADGTAWAWGGNSVGQLGNNTFGVQQSSPVSVFGGHSFVAVAAGGSHSLGLKANGAVLAWGSNTSGQCGDNTAFAIRDFPVSVAGNHSFVRIAAALNGNHSLALKADGTMWAWGANASGQLGDLTTSNRSSPVFMGFVPQQNPVTTISAGGSHVAALRPDGSAIAWGSNSSGQLGDGSATTSSTPRVVTGGNSFSSIAAGGSHTLALKADGTVQAWGLNSTGQLGDATLTPRSAPASVVGNHSFVAIAAGTSHSVGLKANNGTIWAWGDNYDGRLGTNSTTFKSSPTSIVGGHSFMAIAAGDNHTLALKADGTAWAWGGNGDGGIGDGTFAVRSSPVSVLGGLSFIKIAAGFGASVGLRSDGTVWTWGNGDMLGNGTTTDVTSPVSVLGNHSFSSISCGNSGDHFVALKADGTAWAWGLNASGQLGTGDNSGRSSPTSIAGGRSFTSVTAGGSSSAGAMSDNSAFSWGNDSNGQLGDGTTTSKNSPVAVFQTANALTFVHLFTDMSAGNNHSVGRKADGTIWAWGSNSAFQLGDGTCVDRSSPTSVAGSNSFVAVAAGKNHTVALKATGEVQTFGYNDKGQLGIVAGATRPLIPSASNPTFVAGTNYGLSFTSISAGGYHGGAPHSAGLLADGSAWAWGYNSQGQCGDGTIITRGSPVRTLGQHSFVALSALSINTMALKADGSIWAWGSNSFGSLLGTFDNRSPYQLAPMSFSEVATGLHHQVSLMSDGTVWASGLGGQGQLGIGDITGGPSGGPADRSSPLMVIGIKPSAPRFVKVSAGGGHGLGIAPDGTVWAWGNNSNGQLANGVGGQINSPTLMIGATGSFVDVSAGSNQSVALRSDGQAFTCGYNPVGDLGDNSVIDKAVLVPVLPAQSFTMVRASTSPNNGHDVALKADGSAWAWGWNQYGQLGNGTLIDASTPKSVAGGMSFLTVSSGSYHSVAIRADGTAWSWGYNGNGELGTSINAGTGTPNSSPLSVVGRHTFVQIFASDRVTLALKPDGTAWAWGYNNFGQLGDETTTDRSSPVSVHGNHSFVALSMGYTHAAGLKADGSAWMWGYNGTGTLGDETTTHKSSPVSVHGGLSFSSISAGNTFTFAQSNGITWAWGNDPYGVLGQSQAGVAMSSPVMIYGQATLIPQAIHVATNVYTSGLLASDGSVWSWGEGSQFALGNGLATSRQCSPVTLLGSHSFVSLKYGNRAGMALKADGTVWMWGANGSGQMGDETTTDKSSPTSVHGNHSFVGISMGNTHAMALKADGTAWAWGYNGTGTLGDGTFTFRSSPVSVFGGHSFVKVAAGGDCSYGLKADGTIWTWGENGNGQAGQQQEFNSGATNIPGIMYANAQFHSMTAIEAADTFSVAIRGDGTVWTWGQSAFGRLGNNSTTDMVSPTSVIGGHIATSISARGDHSFLLKANGTLWGWGRNDNFQVGDGTTTAQSSPTSVIGNHSFVSAAGGATHSLALKADGTAWAWGSNNNGECGTNTSDFSGRSSPTLVVGGHSFVRLSAGVSFSAGLKADGTMWTWGLHNSGQLGNEDAAGFDQKSSPVSVHGNHSFVTMSCGTTHMAALKADGTAWSWGANNSNIGQLGDGTYVFRSSPVSVLGGHSFVEITAADRGTVARKADGSVWEWGNGVFASDLVYRSSPVQVALFSAGISFGAIAASNDHALALRKDGSVYAWGGGASGRLGYGDTPDHSIPAAVHTTLGLYSFTDISAGSQFALAINANGSAWAWGLNSSFQLGEKPFPHYGDGAPSRSSPVAVCTNFPYKSVSAGMGSRPVALRKDGTLFAWGDVEEITNKSTPTIINRVFN